MANVTISDLNPIADVVSSMKVAVDRYDAQGLPVETNNVSIAQIAEFIAISGDAPPVGTILTWMTPNIPAGHLLCDGSEFDTQLYPALALVFPTGILPQFGGRVQKQANPEQNDVVGAFQGQQNLAHSHTMNHKHTRGDMEITGSFIADGSSVATGAFSAVTGADGGNDGGGRQYTFSFAASKSWTGSTSNASDVNTGSWGASEMRVNSLLCQFIVRAR